MATLPRFDSQQNVTAQTAGPVMQGRERSLDALKGLNETVADIAGTWSQANDVMQYTKAKAKYESAASSILMRAAQDPDFNKSKEYFAELDKVRNESIEGIDNKLIADKTSLELGSANDIAKLKIESQFRKKQIESNKADMVILIDSHVAKKVVAEAGGSSSEAQNNELEIKKILQTNIDSGTIGPEDVSRLTEYIKKTYLNAVEQVIYSDPQAGIDAVKAGAFDLNPENESKMVELGQNLIEKRDKIEKWQIKQTNTKYAIELSNDLLNQSLDHQKIRFLQQSGKIDSETAAVFDSVALKKTPEIPAATSLAEPDYFLQLIKDSTGDKIQAKKILNDAARAYGENKLGTNQYLYFIQQASEQFDRENKGLTGMSENQSKMRNVVDGLKKFNEVMNPLSEENKKGWARGMWLFMNLFKPGDDPEKVKNDVIDIQFNEKMQSKEAGAVSGKPGVVRMKLPNGKLVDVPAANVKKALDRGAKYAE